MAEKLHIPTDTFFASISKEYKRCRLVDRDGALLVNYNAIKTPIKEKLKEVKRKIAAMPDGIYVLQCQYTMNPAPTPNSILIKKGNVSLNEGEEIILPAKNSLQVKTERKDSEADIYTVKATMARIEEISDLRTQIAILEMKLQQKDKEIADLEAELEEEPEEGGLMEGLLNGGENSPLKSLAELLPGLADSYFNMKNRELGLKEKAFQKKSVPVNNKSGQRFKVAKQRMGAEGQLNLSDPSKVEQYFGIIEGLSEEEFSEEVERVKTAQPNLFAMLCEEFGLDEDGQQIEEEEEEEEQV